MKYTIQSLSGTHEIEVSKLVRKWAKRVFTGVTSVTK